jgi:hypothetical protein
VTNRNVIQFCSTNFTVDKSKSFLFSRSIILSFKRKLRTHNFECLSPKVLCKFRPRMGKRKISLFHFHRRTNLLSCLVICGAGPKLQLLLHICIFCIRVFCYDKPHCLDLKFQNMIYIKMALGIAEPVSLSVPQFPRNWLSNHKMIS